MFTVLEASAISWKIHVHKPSTHVLTPPKLHVGALREVARDNIYSIATWHVLPYGIAIHSKKETAHRTVDITAQMCHKFLHEGERNIRFVRQDQLMSNEGKAWVGHELVKPDKAHVTRFSSIITFLSHDVKKSNFEKYSRVDFTTQRQHLTKMWRTSYILSLHDTDRKGSNLF